MGLKKLVKIKPVKFSTVLKDTPRNVYSLNNIIVVNLANSAPIPTHLKKLQYNLTIPLKT